MVCRPPSVRPFSTGDSCPCVLNCGPCPDGHWRTMLDHALVWSKPSSKRHVRRVQTVVRYSSHVVKETFPNWVSRSASNPKIVRPNQSSKRRVGVQTDQELVRTSNSEHWDSDSQIDLACGRRIYTSNRSSLSSKESHPGLIPPAPKDANMPYSFFFFWAWHLWWRFQQDELDLTDSDVQMSVGSRCIWTQSR